MANGIPTSNILQPGGISAPYIDRQLIVDLQLLTPQFYNKYVEKYGDEAYTWWMATYAGMEEVKNLNFFWFENRGKNQFAVSNLTQVTTPAAGATVSVTVADGYYDGGTYNPIRVGETVRTASSNIEGLVLTLDTTTPGAFVVTIRPKLVTQAFVSAGSTSLLAGEYLLLSGDVDAGEASNSINPQIHLDQRLDNYVTEMRDTYSASDLGEMTDVYYTSGVTGQQPAGGAQAGTSYFTYKSLVKTTTRFNNNTEFKLMRGNLQTNTGMGNNSNGTKGFIAQVQGGGETVTYSQGNLGIAKLHEITRIMDVNGCVKDNMWLMDIFQRQQFSDSIFAAYPAGAYVWGKNELSQDASIAYGVDMFKIDGYMLRAKKYGVFNTEKVYGVTPETDAFRNYGIICPMGGNVPDAVDSQKTYKNVTVMYQQPPAGGTIGNGIRVWQHGGGSRNPSNGQMKDNVEMITYRGLRVVAANQFVIVDGDFQ